MLKGIGFWISGVNDERLPAPQELVGYMPAGERDRIATYLEAGMTYESYLGYSWCRFGCGVDWTRMGSRDLTDGSWVWPEGLPHYIREHGIVLPQDFNKHAQSRTPPVVPAQLGDSQPEPFDTDYWEHWASIRRWPGILEDLRTARQAAEKSGVLRRAKEVGRLEKQRGLASTTCCRRGCPRRALSGMYICAEHFVGHAPHGNRHYQRRIQNGLQAILARLSRSHGVRSDFRMKVTKSNDTSDALVRFGASSFSPD